MRVILAATSSRTIPINHPVLWDRRGRLEVVVHEGVVDKERRTSQGVGMRAGESSAHKSLENYESTYTTNGEWRGRLEAVVHEGDLGGNFVQLYARRIVELRHDLCEREFVGSVVAVTSNESAIFRGRGRPLRGKAFCILPAQTSCLPTTH